MMWLGTRLECIGSSPRESGVYRMTQGSSPKEDRDSLEDRRRKLKSLLGEFTKGIGKLTWNTPGDPEEDRKTRWKNTTGYWIIGG
ncbi:hypothetical protein BHM03_00061349 [Ensete ventricosum]|nr:hypothetical protein BHM03_00061349 [Ensete ventricosum]